MQLLGEASEPPAPDYPYGEQASPSAPAASRAADELAEKLRAADQAPGAGARGS